jgi:hypothetical protein
MPLVICDRWLFRVKVLPQEKKISLRCAHCEKSNPGVCDGMSHAASFSGMVTMAIPLRKHAQADCPGTFVRI